MDSYFLPQFCMSPIDSLRMNLRNSLSMSGVPPYAFAKAARVSRQGLINFLEGKHPTAKRTFISKIENAMIKKNWKQQTETEPLPVKTVRVQIEKASPLSQKLRLCSAVLVSNLSPADKEKIAALVLQ